MERLKRPVKLDMFEAVISAFNYLYAEVHL